MTSQLPEWRKAWRLDDPAWVKQRKAEWKRIKGRLPEVAWFVPKSEHIRLKNYFLTGSGYSPEPPEADWARLRYDPNRPLWGVEAPVLFECWLNPDRSEANWQSIVARYVPREARRADGSVFPHIGLYGPSRTRFRELLRNHFPAEGSLFDGLEERLYRLLGPTRCRPEDFPELDRAAYLRECERVYATLGKPIDDFLGAAKVNPENIAPALVREWCDSVPGTYEEKKQVAEEHKKPEYLNFFLQKDLGQLVARAHKTMELPEKHNPRQVAVARDILACLSQMSLPEEVKRHLDPYLNDGKTR